MPVLDASVVVAYLAGGDARDAVRERLLDSEESLWAPQLVDAEVGHVLRRAVLIGELTFARGESALVDLADLALRRSGHLLLFPRAWELLRNVSFYDGLYVALAERLDMPLLTLDRRLSGAPGVRASVEVLA